MKSRITKLNTILNHPSFMIDDALFWAEWMTDHRGIPDMISVIKAQLRRDIKNGRIY